MPLRCAGAAGVQEKIPPHCCGGIFESAIEESTLGELGSATGGLEAVLFIVCRRKPLKTLTFFARHAQITSNVTSKKLETISTFRESLLPQGLRGFIFSDYYTFWYR